MVDSAPTQKLESKGNEAEVRIPCSDSACEIDDENDKNDSENLTNEDSSFVNAMPALSQKASVNLGRQVYKLCTVMSKEIDCESSILNCSDTTSSIQADSLRFEV